jgi:hypothetical protein
MDSLDGTVRPGVLSDLVGGIEDEVRDTSSEPHVADFDLSGTSVDPDGSRVFTDEYAMNKCTRELSKRDTAVIIRYVDEETAELYRPTRASDTAPNPGVARSKPMCRR